jgi:RNA polymerase sigma factor (sigma-70 family)
MRLLKCKADAEDVVQETFARWLSAEQEKIQNTKAYLIKAVTNNCLNHLDSLRRKKQQCLDSIHWSEFVEKIKVTSDFSHIDIEAEMARACQILHQKLEPLERAIYVLKEAFDFDYKSLQELFNKKQEHCRQLFCRAKKKLQEEGAKIHFSLPEGSEWLKSFRAASAVGQSDDFIHQLKQDVSLARLHEG